MLQGNSLKNLNEAVSTAVFIDYECWFWALHNKGEKTNLDKFKESIKNRGSLNKITFFGDFTKGEIKDELKRLRTITTDIIDCANEGGRKDYTDFIMLDHIYRTVISQPEIKQYILVTGDGHFHGVVSYLRTYQDKIVGIMGVERSISKQLQDCSSWYEIIDFKTDIQQYYPIILDGIKWAENKEIKLGFNKTVTNVSKIHNVDSILIKAALRDLIDKSYIKQEKIDIDNGQNLRILVPNWGLLVHDGLWKD